MLEKVTVAFVKPSAMHALSQYCSVILSAMYGIAIAVVFFPLRAYFTFGPTSHVHSLLGTQQILGWLACLISDIKRGFLEGNDSVYTHPLSVSFALLALQR